MSYTVRTGASSGIGYATAINFAEKGRDLIVIARNREKLIALKNEIKMLNSYVSVKIFSFDLSDNQLLHEKIFPTLDQFDIDILINNAGFGIAGNILSSKIHTVEEMIDLNIKPLISLSIWFVEKYKEEQNKQLLNILSTAGYTINTRAVLYAASKNFVATFTEGLAIELKRNDYPLQVKVLAPYATETNFAKISLGLNEFSYEENYKLPYTYTKGRVHLCTSSI